MRFNPPPGWPIPPTGWLPPAGWKPDPGWPTPPDGWRLLIAADEDEAAISPQEPAPSDDPDPPAAGGTSTRDDPTRAVEEVDLLRARVALLESQLAAAGTSDAPIELDDQRVLQDVGIYRYHHPLETAAAYKDRLKELEVEIDTAVKAGDAVLAADMFTLDGSLAKGRRMVGDLSKLMLRAYNAEADNCVRSLRSGNVQTAKRRLESAMAAIQRLGSLMEMRVNPTYHLLRVAELELVADYQMKVQEERERAREQREELREQRRVEAELAAQKEKLDKERAHMVGALEALTAKGDQDAVGELQDRLAQIDEAIAANDYRIANIRAGYVYVISNVGAFGPSIVKVGMTRRLEPMDRVRELGDASVPFRFDVHALYFSQDAVTLENELHKALADRRVNWVNERREFFFATPAEVRDLLAEKVGGLLEYADKPDAPEYFQSRTSWPPHIEGLRSYASSL